MPLYFSRPGFAEEDDERWAAATRPCLPLRNRAVSVVTKEEWDQEYEEATRHLWTQPINATAHARSPAYRLPDAAHAVRSLDPEALDALRAALPPEDFIREVCHDARELVIGCAIHVCSPSCWKYHSKGASHICRHNFYHAIY